MVRCPYMLIRRFSLAAIELNRANGGIQNGKAHINLTRVLFVIPHSHVSASETVFGVSIGVLWPDRTLTTSESATTSDCKDVFCCTRMEFILTHVAPAGCTSSDDMDAPILHNEGGQLNERNLVSFWWSPDVGVSLVLCILTRWNVEPVWKCRKSGLKAGLIYPGRQCYKACFAYIVVPGKPLMGPVQYLPCIFHHAGRPTS